MRIKEKVVKGTIEKINGRRKWGGRVWKDDDVEGGEMKRKWEHEKKENKGGKENEERGWR